MANRNLLPLMLLGAIKCKRKPPKNGVSYNLHAYSHWPTLTPTHMQMGCKTILSVLLSASVYVSASVNRP